MSPAVERVREALERCGCNPKPNGSGWKFRCPAHEDRNPSGVLSEGDDGRALLHCHAGCTADSIVGQIGLSTSELFADDATRKPARRETTSYDYVDENGALLFQSVRFVPKDFRQRRPDGKGGWTWNLQGTRRVLYRLPEVLEVVSQGGTVYVVEGEKDADAINAADPDAGLAFVATCNPGGAGKWRPEFSDTLKGASVVIVADKDEPGRKHALDVRAALQGIAGAVRIVEAKAGKDAADHLAAGHARRDLVPYQEPGSADDAGPRVVPVDLYDPSIKPTRPEFDVTHIVRREGVHLVWAEPSAGKTWLLLRAVHELTVDTGTGRLWKHPELWINRRFDRVLWIATEEDAKTLRFKAEHVRRGLGITVEAMRGRLDYVFAAQADKRVTLDDLPELLEATRYDAVILDSLTGLRPKTVNGERIRWDADNDAANEQCLRLRSLASAHGTDLVIVHHTGRETSRGYRGPADWWASADVMFGLVPDAGRTKVIVEKNRDGKRIAPFYLVPMWEGDTYTLEYDGAATPEKLSPTAKAVLAWFKGKGQASQAEAKSAGLGAGTTVVDAIRTLCAVGVLSDTGNKVAGSPIYVAVTEGDGTASDTRDGE